MSRSFAVLCFLLGTFSLFGFGCKERGTARLPGALPATTSVPRPAPVPPVLKSGGVEKGTDPDLLQLEQTLDNLAKTDSYQLDVRLPASGGGTGQGRLLYAKNRGIHATLTNDGISTQLYAHQGTLQVKYSTSSWSMVPPGDEAESVETMIRQAFFSSESGANTLILTGNAQILKKEQDPEGCTLYQLQQQFFVPTTVTERFDICVSGNYPKYIRYVRPEGTSTLTYSRLNDGDILAESPLK